MRKKASCGFYVFMYYRISVDTPPVKKSMAAPLVLHLVSSIYRQVGPRLSFLFLVWKTVFISACSVSSSATVGNPRYYNNTG